jgi:DNA polymerase V
METFTEAYDLSDASLRELQPLRNNVQHIRICSTVPCGKPTPIFTEVQGKLLSEYLSDNPSMTYFFEVTGDSMINADIYSGDVVAVDCRLQPKDGNIVLAEINGELTLKRLKIVKHKASKHGTEKIDMFLLPENPRHQPIHLSDFDDVRIFGVASTKMRVDNLL